MIYIDVIFKSELACKWLIETKEFDNCDMALRFMYSMRNKGNMMINGWRCDDPEDNEYLVKRFKL